MTIDTIKAVQTKENKKKQKTLSRSRIPEPNSRRKETIYINTTNNF